MNDTQKKKRNNRSKSGSKYKTGKNSRQNLYRKSRYYQKQRQKRLRILFGGAVVLLLILLALIVRGCSQKKQDLAEVSSDSAGTVSTTNAENEKGSDFEKKSQDTDGESEADPSLPKEPVSLTVSVVGDCTLGTDENFDYDTSLNAYYESYGADYFFANVKSIFSADDLTIANFEGTLTDSEAREDKQFAFKAPAEFADILTAGSIEAVNTANNHSHDYGEQSFSDTMAALDSRGIVHFGYDETAVMEIKGVKVGLVGIYELNDHLGREEQLKQNIAKVKEDGAQIIIVIFHWGNEKEEVPDSNQTTLGRLAIDEGADLVCGHHPHVLQGIEEYKGKNIVYSLGNFCFGGNSYPSDMDSMIFQQTFTVDQNGLKEDNVTNIIPCSISSDYDYNNYQPTPAEGEEADRILQKINERSSWIPTAGNTGEGDTGSE
ncbi:MAG TPA: CapA family protein [Candidatus Blautia intestinavium]|nr:CapA family protein [Candidatus Blautia intestinavium]